MSVVRARAEGEPEAAGEAANPAERDYQLDGLLRQINLLARTPQVDHKLGWKTPIIGHAWLVFRRRLHQEIRIYIDLLSRQQTSFNVGVARAVSALAASGQAQAAERRIAGLEAEVAALRREVAELRSALAGAATEPSERGGRDTL